MGFWVYRVWGVGFMGFKGLGLCGFGEVRRLWGCGVPRQLIPRDPMANKAAAAMTVPGRAPGVLEELRFRVLSAVQLWGLVQEEDTLK